MKSFIVTGPGGHPLNRMEAASAGDAADAFFKKWEDLELPACHVVSAARYGKQTPAKYQNPRAPR